MISHYQCKVIECRVRKRCSLSALSSGYEPVLEHHWIWHSMKRESNHRNTWQDIQTLETPVKKFKIGVRLTVQENKMEMHKIEKIKNLLESKKMIKWIFYIFCIWKIEWMKLDLIFDFNKRISLR